ncbi:MAG TPA: HU family DNA-binding protein [Ignavibacteria bacterium]|nr:HU family DNA-binding protein [Ignavibacteria bacterium]
MEITENPFNESSERRRRNADRVKTLTRKDIEMKMEEKLVGKKITRKLIVDSLFDSLRELIMSADPVIRIEIRDFGVFEVKKTKPKPKARNLKTGEFVYVPGRRKMHFKPGKLLKNYLKDSSEKDALEEIKIIEQNPEGENNIV